MAELLFIIGFIVVIVAILLVDMLAIDREAHEVSLKQAGIWTALWISLALIFAVFIWFYGDVIHGIKNVADLQEVVEKYHVGITVDPNDFDGSLIAYKHNMTVSYISGYLIEKMLSVDNLFVMMAIFAAFNVEKKEYQHVLDWGIIGAIVLRLVFIFLGAAIISQFNWVLYVFGVILLWSGVKMYINRNNTETVEIENNPVVKFLSKHFRVFPKFVGDKFFVKAKKTGTDVEVSNTSGAKWYITPLLVTVIFIEFSDIIFAFDSIPAVFSVSLDPYVVFFSNIFAILGLRAMFFLLAGIVDKFRYLKAGVCLLLVFIGFKLLTHGWIYIDATLSLIIILVVLFGSIGLSLINKSKNNDEDVHILQSGERKV